MPKINISDTSRSQASQISKPLHAQRSNPFDLDVKVVSFAQTPQPREVVTSKSLCTPGCGNTGTGNSYCCTC